MIADILQYEKMKIKELLENITESIEKLQFINMTDYRLSGEFKEKWNDILKKLFWDLYNYQKNEFPM